MSDEQCWAADAPLLSQVLDEAAYLLAVRVGSAAGRAYRYGLGRLLGDYWTDLPR